MKKIFADLQKSNQVTFTKKKKIIVNFQDNKTISKSKDFWSLIRDDLHV